MNWRSRGVPLCTPAHPRDRQVDRKADTGGQVSR